MADEHGLSTMADLVTPMAIRVAATLRIADHIAERRRTAPELAEAANVFVIEKIGVDGESPSTEMDLRMLAYFGARERGLAQLTTLAAGAGLKVAALHPAGATPILELTAV